MEKRSVEEDIKPTQQGVKDALDLADLGHAPELSRKFNMWSMLSLAFCVLGTWSVFAQDLDSGLSNGGSIAILWGLAVVLFCNICVALSLGEMCSAMPTALGQAYWVHRIYSTPVGRFISYICAWTNTFGWWTLTASQNAFMTNLLLEMKVIFEPDWAGATTGWLEFVVYVGVTVLFTVVNCISCRNEKVLPWFNNTVAFQFVALMVVFSLALLIAVGTKDHLSFQSAKFVFGNWINLTDWPDGVVWFTGLLQAAYGLTAFDAVIHMVEEIPAPRVNVPKVLYLAVIFGAVSGGIFMMVCLFCIQDIDSLLDTPTGLPFVQLVTSSIGKVGGAVLMALFIFNGMGQGVSVMTSASRLTWGFARDGGMPFSNYLARIDGYWQAPIRALWLECILISLIGVLYLFAETVLQAILSVSTIALTISYAIPIMTLLICGRDTLPPGEFKLGKFGPIINWISLIYCCITTVFFFFPETVHPTPSDMNYAIAVFGIMLVISLGFWFIKGSKTYLQTNEAQIEILRARELETH
jgi:choline transport protein